MVDLDMFCSIRSVHRSMTGIACCLVLASLAGAASAQPTSVPQLVDVGQQAVLFRPEVRARAGDLVALSETGADDDRLVRELEGVRTASELAPAERDAVLYQYLQRLRGRPSHEIPDAAVDWLSGYRSQAERLHDESAVARVALFDVASAAHGLRHEKRHRLAAERVVDASDQELPALLDEYRRSVDTPWRGGVELAVADLPRQRLDRLAQLLDTDQDLAASALAVRVRIARADRAGLVASFTALAPEVATQTLRTVVDSLSPGDAFAVAEAGLAHEDAGVRGLAIAQASTLAASDEQLAERWHAQLLQLLARPDDGVAAALHLARSLSPEQIHILAKQAGENTDLQRRWRLVQHYASQAELDEVWP